MFFLQIGSIKDFLSMIEFTKEFHTHAINGMEGDQEMTMVLNTYFLLKEIAVKTL